MIHCKNRSAVDMGGYLLYKKRIEVTAVIAALRRNACRVFPRKVEVCWNARPLTGRFNKQTRALWPPINDAMRAQLHAMLLATEVVAIDGWMRFGCTAHAQIHKH